MKIDIFCSDEEHPISPWLKSWCSKNEFLHESRILSCKKNLKSGDILFLVSCTEIIPVDLRKLYRYCITLHASDLPAGRGWSPHIWSILEGATVITVSALNAEDRVDTGDVWAKKTFSVKQHEIYDEINTSLFEVEIELLDEVIRMVEGGVEPFSQDSQGATYYPRRKPHDSELDPNLTITEQFDKLRVCDPSRYPAFFKIYGKTYTVIIKKEKRDE